MWSCSANASCPLVLVLNQSFQTAGNTKDVAQARSNRSPCPGHDASRARWCGADDCCVPPCGTHARDGGHHALARAVFPSEPRAYGGAGGPGAPHQAAAQGSVRRSQPRAALNVALGAASSFPSNYSRWLDDTEREPGSRPPRLGLSGVFPSLYGGNTILVAEDLRSVRLKLLNTHGVWRFRAPLPLKGHFKRLSDVWSSRPRSWSEAPRCGCPVR